ACKLRQGIAESSPHQCRTLGRPFRETSRQRPRSINARLVPRSAVTTPTVSGRTSACTSLGTVPAGGSRPRPHVRGLACARAPAARRLHDRLLVPVLPLCSRCAATRCRDPHPRAAASPCEICETCDLARVLLRSVSVRCTALPPWRGL